MLDRRQVVVLVGTGMGFWLADAAWIRLLPIFVVSPVWGDVGFLLSVPVAWVCVRVVLRLAGLAAGQLVAGTAVMVVVAALIHAVAFRWVPDLYGDDHTGRLGAAWLLWIYGLLVAFALLMARAGGGERSMPSSPRS